MPPMWTVPLRVMAGFALAAGGDGPAPVRRSVPGGRVARGFAAGGDGVGVVARSGCPGHLAGVPGLLRGDAPGQALVGALGVAGCGRSGRPVSRGLGDGVGQGLPARVAEQGLVEALVLALGGGPVGSAGDGFDAQGAHVLHQAAGDSAPAGVEGRAVVGQQALGHAPGGYALVEDVDGRLTGLARGDQGGHRQAGVVVLELEDHRLAPAGQDVLGGVELPAGVGGGAGRTGATPPSVSWTVRPWPPPPDGRSWPGTPARAPRGPWRPSCRAR